jgi:hypothetical protein
MENYENFALAHTRYAQINGRPEPYHDGIHARVRSEIDRGRPVAIELVFGGYYGVRRISHFNVIYGYLGTKFYYLADPANKSANCCAITDIRGWAMTVFTKPLAGNRRDRRKI